MCGFVGCSRFDFMHALEHYTTSNHPLSMNSETGYVHCYACDGYVLNDHEESLVYLRGQFEIVTSGRTEPDSSDLVPSTVPHPVPVTPMPSPSDALRSRRSALLTSLGGIDNVSRYQRQDKLRRQLPSHSR
jgi:hypothetical protein